MDAFLTVILMLVAATAGVIGGFFLARRYMQKYYEENPPYDEAAIRLMMTQMGQKPSEKKVKQIVQSLKAQSKKSKK